MIRKIIKVGNSDGITIPVHMMRNYKLKAGDNVEVYISKPGSAVEYLEALEELEKFHKKYGKALKKLPKK